MSIILESAKQNLKVIKITKKIENNLLFLENML